VVQTWEAATSQLRTVLDAIAQQLTAPLPPPPTQSHAPAAAARPELTPQDGAAANSGGLPKAQRAILSVLA